MEKTTPKDNWIYQPTIYEGYLKIFLDNKKNNHIPRVETEKDKKYFHSQYQQFTMLAAGVFRSDGKRQFEFRQVNELVKYKVFCVAEKSDAIKVAWCVGLENFLVIRQQNPVQEGVFDFERVLEPGEELEKKPLSDEDKPYGFIVFDFYETENFLQRAELFDKEKHTDSVIEQQEKNKLFLLGEYTAKAHIREIKRYHEKKEARRQMRKNASANFSFSGITPPTPPRKVGLYYESFCKNSYLFDL